ncbi:MAG: 30S ribosomal protein S16 [Candidatus Melainabacteria bacterium GWF2_37_15]|nr:MAG: 30S ribosomal protein S16 [Candidatus Melainabacteria bacterium GWF2_37_15]
MLKIRLKRLGSKKNPIYRVIVIDGREKREGRALEELGHYNPRRKELKLDKVKALGWVKNGAQPTDTVKYLIDNSDDAGSLVRKQVVEEKLSKKAKAKQEAEEKAKVEAKAKAEEEAKAKKEAEAQAQKEAAEKAEAEVKVEEVKTEEAEPAAAE